MYRPPPESTCPYTPVPHTTLCRSHLMPASPNVTFMRLRCVSIAIAVLLAVAALAAIGFKGFNYALDFTGGTLVEMHFDRPANVDHVREQLATAGYDGA